MNFDNFMENQDLDKSECILFFIRKQDLYKKLSNEYPRFLLDIH